MKGTLLITHEGPTSDSRVRDLGFECKNPFQVLRREHCSKGVCVMSSFFFS